MASPVWIGIDLGATNAKAAVVDDSGAVICKAALPLDTTPEGLKPEPVVRKLLDCCEAALSKANLTWGDVSGIGVGSPGALDREAGLVKAAANIFPGMTNIPLRDMIQAGTGCGVSTSLVNDADAGKEES